MSRLAYRMNHLANLLALVSGLGLLTMKYLLEPSDPFAVVNHPLQPDVQYLHVLTVPLLVFATGMMWSHAANGLRIGGRRKHSGLLLVGTFVPMALSGYLIQVATEPTFRTFWTWTHVGASVAWGAGYIWHGGLLAVRRLRAAAALGARGTAPAE